MKFSNVIKAKYIQRRLTNDLAVANWFEYVWELELACKHKSDSNTVATPTNRPPTRVVCKMCKES